jgi:IPT/TIG domain
MRTRVRHPVILLLLVLAAVAILAALAGSAAALPTFTQAQFGIGPCVSCHSQSAIHGATAHATAFQNCANCHAGGNTANPPLPSACAACHGGTATILLANTHVQLGCGTTNGCHGFSAPPTVTSFSPTSGMVGTVVTVTGTQFAGATAVKVGTATATTFTVVTPKSMKVTVPAGAATGPITITTSGGTIASAATFTVTTAPVTPKISKLTPTAGKRGSTVTITGSKFGAKRGTSFVKFGSTKVSKYVSWSASKVKVKVPSKAKFAKLKVTLTTSGGVSNAKTFTVKH